VASAGRLVVLADHTKWGVIGLSVIAALSDASILVSDSGLSPEAREVIEGTVGELIVADSQGLGSADAAAL
jgi:DeoR/GlpR family transcriptional regulator of sugar metabolism